MKNDFGIICFKGSVQEYERWKGYKVDIVGANATLYPVLIESNGKCLTEEEAKGIEALVNAQYVAPTIIGNASSIYGLPVKAKNKK